MKEIRIGLVGSGWMGKAHSSALADAEMLFGPDYGTASFEIVADANEETPIRLLPSPLRRRSASSASPPTGTMS